MYTQVSDYWFNKVNRTGANRFSITEDDIQGDILPLRDPDYEGALKIKDLLYIGQMCADLTGSYVKATTSDITTAKQVGKKLLDCGFTSQNRNVTTYVDGSPPYMLTAILANLNNIEASNTLVKDTTVTSTDYLELLGIQDCKLNLDLPAYSEFAGKFDAQKLKRIYDSFFRKGLFYCSQARTGAYPYVTYENAYFHWNSGWDASGVRTRWTTSYKDGKYVEESTVTPNSWSLFHGQYYNGGEFLGWIPIGTSGYASNLYSATNYQTEDQTLDKVYVADQTNEADFKVELNGQATVCKAVFRFNYYARTTPNGDTKSDYYYIILDGTIDGRIVTFDLLPIIGKVKSAIGWNDSNLIGKTFPHSRYNPYMEIYNPTCMLVISNITPRWD